MNDPSQVPVDVFEPTGPRVLPHPDPDAPPVLAPGHLDALWFQVAGTVCNIRCDHCFISCGPANRTFDLLPLEEVRRRLDEAGELGVRELYFTGGEPFVHPDIVEILALAVARAPTTVLTNGMLVKARHLRPLAAAAATSPYSLEFRVSIDGFEAGTHDAIRGAGSFEAALRGMGLLLAHGFLPIVTAVRTWDEAEDPEVFRGFVELLRSRGYANPRIKLMPALRIGAESARSGGYGPADRVTNAMMEAIDPGSLVCASTRVVTDRGIWVCPILLDEADGNLGDDLTAAAEEPYTLRHGACSTCWLHGAICSNAGGLALEVGVAGDAEPFEAGAAGDGAPLEAGA